MSYPRELHLDGVLRSSHTSSARKSRQISADSKPIHSPFSYIAVSYLSYKSSTGYGRKQCRRRYRVNQDEQTWERLELDSRPDVRRLVAQCSILVVIAGIVAVLIAA